MVEVTGNLWDYPADVRVITTNGTVKKNGECVMGRGCAREFAQMWPTSSKGLGIAKLLGTWIRESGNVPSVWGYHDYHVITFPVKHNWYERADINLIADSASRLQNMPFLNGGTTVVMPRPGCGNGGLRWEDVKPVLAPILDDRFHVITFR